MFDRAHPRTGHAPQARPPAPRPRTAPAQVLSLQRAVGNHAVARLLARADAPAPAEPAPPERVSYVFLMGDVSDAFYKRAKEVLERQFPAATVVPDKRTLADVIAHVNAAGKPVDTLYLVSHGLESGTLMFSVDPADQAKDAGAGQKARTDFGELTAANAAGTLPAADTALIDAQTKIEVKGCNVGRSERMLDALDVALGGKATVTAPTHAQQF
jgi:hypothetical protein